MAKLLLFILAFISIYTKGFGQIEGGQLPEIVIEANEILIESKLDSIAKSSSSISELLQNKLGVQFKDGEAYYQGEVIEGFLLNGMKLYGGQIELLDKILSAKHLDNIAIHREQDKSLKLKLQVNSYVFTKQVEAFLGVRDKYDGLVSFNIISPKNLLNGFYSKNNIQEGKLPQSLTITPKSFKGISRFQELSDGIDGDDFEGDFSIKEYRIGKFSEELFGGNISHKSKKIDFQSMLIGMENEGEEYEEEDRYLVFGNPEAQDRSSTLRIKKLNKFLVKQNVKINLDKYKLGLYSKYVYDNDQIVADNSLDQKLTNEFVHSDYTQIKSPKKKHFENGAYISFSDRKWNFVAELNHNRMNIDRIDTLYENNKLVSFASHTEEKQQLWKGELGVRYKFNYRWSAFITYQYRHQDNGYKAQILRASDVDIERKDDFIYSSHFHTLGTWLRYSHKGNILTINTLYNISDYKLGDKKGSQNSLLPNIRYNWQKPFSGSISLTQEQKLEDLSIIMPAIQLQDNRYFSNGNPGRNAIVRNQKVNLEGKFNIFKKYQLQINLQHSIGIDRAADSLILLQTAQLNIPSLQNFDQVSRSANLIFNNNAIGSGMLLCFVQFMEFNRYSIINDQLNEQKLREIYSSVLINGIRHKSWKTNINIVQSYNLTGPFTASWSLKPEMIWKSGKIEAKIKIDQKMYYSSKIQLQAPLIDFEVNQTNKNWQFYVKVANMLEVKRLFTNHFSQEAVSSRWSELYKRFIGFGVIYRT